MSRSNKICSIALLGALILVWQGCGGLKPRQVALVEETVYATIEKLDEGFKIQSLSDTKGDIDLRSMKATSDSAVIRLCGDKENSACLDKVLDSIEKSGKRDRILARYNGLVRGNKEHIKRLEAIYERFQPSYEADKGKMLLHYLVNDESKLYKGEKLPFEEMLFVGMNELKYPPETAHKKDLHDLFPVDEEDFTHSADRIEKELADAYIKDKKTYEETIAYRSSFYPLKRRDNLKEGLFTLRIQAPDRVSRASSAKQRVIFHVTGKDIKDLYPYDFAGQNSDLKIDFSKRVTRFTNRSSKDISLESITLFYNGYNQTTLLGRDFSFAQLKAKEATSTPSTLFFTDHFQKAAVFPEMSQSKAERKSVDFGIQVKYKIEGKSLSQFLNVSKKELLWHYIAGW